ncbi:kinase-like domain-containing protein [Globomyces pollinis-pini]|nr:kinase-like domain-containing protein [Globomyces pollinis-pini]
MSGNLKEIFLSTIERYFVGLESITCISDKRTRFVFKLQFMCDEPDEEPDYDTVSIQYMKIIPTSDIPEMEITQILDCTPFLNTEDCFEFGEEPALDFAGFIISDVGDSIRDMITNKMCFTWVEFKILFTTLMLNLCRMHERGYIHMNIHGGNVCIKYRCSHLIDFQYAVKMDEHGKIKNGLISSVYRAPEVCNDGDDLTAAVDVYAAGRMLQDVLSYGLVKGSPDQLTKLSELLSKMTYVEPLERPTALDAYHMFVESENELPGIPSLASLSNAKIIQALNEYPLDNVELLGSLLESRLPDFLPQIRYRPFKVLVENNGIPDWKDGVTVDQYYTYLENSYRELFVENRSSPILDNPYLLLEKIHISISDYLADPLQPDLENNMYFFKPKLEFNQKTICGQEQFKIQWNHFTGGIFQNICLDNLFFAGGAVLAALQPFDSSKDLEEQFTNSGFYNSDIDIFVYGITDPVAATARVAQFCEELLLQTSDEVLFVRSRHTITIIRPHPHRQLQVILRLYKSPAEILIGFDIDSCSVGYDGKDVYGLPRFVRSVITGYNVIDITRRSPSYEYRLYKYSKRGFGVLVPGVSRKNCRFLS